MRRCGKIVFADLLVEFFKEKIVIERRDCLECQNLMVKSVYGAYFFNRKKIVQLGKFFFNLDFQMVKRNLFAHSRYNLFVQAVFKGPDFFRHGKIYYKMLKRVLILN